MTVLADAERRVGPIAWLALGAVAGLLGGAIVAVAGPLPVVAVIAGLLALVAAIKAPGVVLAAYLLIPFYKGALQDYSPVDITILLALVNAAQVIPLVLEGRRRNVAVVGIALWLCLGLLVLGGALYAPDQSLALGRAVAYWALVIIPIFPAAMRVGATPRHVDQFLWSFFVMGVVAVVLGIVQLSASDRLVVLGMNTIQVGRAALLVPLIGVAYILPQRRPIPSLVTVVMVPVAFVVAIASGSRGPLLVFAVVAVAGAVRYFGLPHAARGRVLGAGIGLALLVVVVLAVAGPNLPALSLARFSSLIEFIQGSPSGLAAIPGGETSAAARVRLFEFAGELWTRSPFIGVGTGGFEALNARALGAAADTYPHNAVLQVASEYGLLGLALFLGAVSIALLRRLPGRLTGFTVRALFAFFLLNAMVSGDIFNDRETLGLLLLVLAIEAPVAIAAGVGGSSPADVGTAPEPSAAGSAPRPVATLPGTRLTSVPRRWRDRTGGSQAWI